MRQTWLLVDCSYLGHRAFHSTGGLSYNGAATGVSFGILRDLEVLTDLFAPARFVLAFDSKVSLREKVYPNYKITRKTRSYTPEELQGRQAFREEMERLRTHFFPQIGYRNVFLAEGYEADDIIAKVAAEIPPDVDGMIVSTDGDLLQCLRENVYCYNPKSRYTTSAASFREKWGIDPPFWAEVKAWAGCKTDDIEGVRGVGEAYASLYVAGKLKPDLVSYKSIVANQHIFETNLPLTRLPYPGLILPPLVPDEITEVGQTRARAELGIRRPAAAATPYGVIPDFQFD